MLIQCPECKLVIVPENYPVKDNTGRCPECKSALPAAGLAADEDPLQILKTIPTGVKIRETPTGVILSFCRFAWAKTAFYLIGITLIMQFLEPVTRHWRDGDLSTIWVECLFGLLAAGVTAWLVFELCGKNEIRESDGQLTLFAGVGPVGVSRRLQIGDVAKIRFVASNNGDSKYRSDYHIEITLADDRSITFLKSHDRDAVRYFYVWLRQKTNSIQ